MTVAVSKPRTGTVRYRGTPGDPFTVEHFERWAYELELDNGGRWRVEEFFALFLQDYFSGVPESWLLVPEGNTKTTSLGGLGCYLLEWRDMAEVPWAASSRDQAEIGYRQAAGFVRRSTRLSNFLRPLDGYRRIKNTRDEGRLQVFAADDRTGDGIIPTDGFLDELHRHADLSLYRTWRGKLHKRGGQIATISTAGEPGSDFEETRTLIRQSTPVVERRPGFVRCRSDEIAFHEYAVPDDGDSEDLDLVKAANPFSAITVESLARKRSTPTMTPAHWRRFTCNLATRGDEAAITELEWERAATTTAWPAGEPIWVGLDVAWKWDTTAVVPLYMPDLDTRLLGAARILEPPRDASSLDPDLVEQALLEVHKVNPVHTVVMDMTRAEQLAVWIERELGATVIDRAQTTSLAALDYERFMEGLRSDVLKHTGDPGLKRHALNAIAKLLPGGGARFERPSGSRNKTRADMRVIDALVAASMAHCVAVGDLTAPETTTGWRGL